jgi:hypothetical protein
LYTEFLFKEFLYQFRRFFDIRKPRYDEIFAKKEEEKKNSVEKR